MRSICRSTISTLCRSVAFLAVGTAVGISADYGMPPVQAAALDLTHVAAAPLHSIDDTPPGDPDGPIGLDPGAGRLRLPGHVLSALSAAIPVIGDVPGALTSSSSMTVTITLKHDDQEGFERYLKRVYDPRSAQYRRFLKQTEITRKYGPSAGSYGAVVDYLRKAHLALVQGSGNRMTLTMRGSRQAVEAAFATRILDYRIGDRYFYANTSDPALPKQIARRVVGISGLNDLARPEHGVKAIRQAFAVSVCILMLVPWVGVIQTAGGIAASQSAEATALIRYYFTQCVNGIMTSNGYDPPYDNVPLYINFSTGSISNSGFGITGGGSGVASAPSAKSLRPHPAASGGSINGAGQTIGLLEFDDFNSSDVADFLALAAAPSDLINNVTKVPVSGGVSAPGAAEDEVLLDIDDVLIAAPGANIKVFETPFTGQAASYSAVFNAMINDGVTIISNSWASCEDQTSAAEVQAIDQVLQSAAASGIGVFSGAGDSGSTCLDGAVNTVAVPADSPHVTAVGGSSLQLGPGFTYQSETWWNGSSATPPTGQGGFGVSRYFARPSYQNGLNAQANRSIPDVVANADPAQGVMICQADNGGCPSGYYYGGTSSSTPLWAAYAALLNQAVGHNLGNLNALIYPLAGTAAFHDANSMQSDFEHVGLGSPNIDGMILALSHKSAGPVSASVSQVYPFGNANSYPPTSQAPSAISADGSSPLYVVVRLMDANGNAVSGKTVNLSSGGSATIKPASGISTASNGSVTFTVTDTIPETLTFKAEDSTDGVVLSQAPSVAFGAPPAVSGGITANPSAEPADGQTAATVTVTLKDALNRPVPGKTVTMADSGAHAVLTGPTPGVTDANGQISFAATDQVSETVNFTAVDVTDGNLPIPGTASVAYSNSTFSSCGVGVAPVAGTGYTITPYVTGLPAAPTIFYQNANIGCPGGQNPAFTSTGTMLVSDFLDGNIYQLGLSGGAASTSNLLSTLTPALGRLVYGKDGNVYATLGNEGAQIVQIDPITGAQLRVVASGLTCPAGLAVDPLSGDLFFDDQCTGGGTDNASIWRVIDPANSDPSTPTSVVVYSTLPSTPNGGLAFAPNGTLYAVSGYYTSTTAPVEQVSPTSASTVTVTPVTGITSDYSVGIGVTNADGSAQSLIVEPSGNLSEIPIANPSAAVVLATGAPGVGVTGPDGCLYSATYDTVYRLASSSGPCKFAPTSPAPSMSITPATVSPNPAQGAAVTFTAVVHNVTPLSGVTVTFGVSGANAQVLSAPTNVSGDAVVTYTGVQTGTDTVVASAAAPSGTPLSSNTVQVNWAAGKHTTFLTLNPSTQGAIANQSVTVSASLTDLAASPSVPLSGQSVTFTLGSSTCTATTNTKGIASCAVTAAQAGTEILKASFPGTSDLVPSGDTAGFTVAGLPTPAPTVTLSVSPSDVVAGGKATLSWSSSNATACTAGGAWSGSEPTAGTAAVSPAVTGSFTYTLTCTGNGGSGAASATLSATLVGVAVTARSGGGAIGWPFAMCLGLLLLLRLRQQAAGRSLLLLVLVSATLGTLSSGAARAQQSAGSATWLDSAYVGVRAGEMPVHINAGRIDTGLDTTGYTGVSADTDTSAFGATLYLGYELAPHADIEFGYTHRSSLIATITGAVPSLANVPGLLQDTAGLIRGYGNIFSLSFRPRFEIAPKLLLDPRVGAFVWSTKVTADAAGISENETHQGGGFTAGLGVAYRVWRGLELGIGADFFRGSPNNIATLYGGSIEWRFGH